MSESAVVSVLMLVSGACFVGMVALGIRSRKARGDDRRKYARWAVLLGAGYFLAMCGMQFVRWAHGSINPAGVILVLCCCGAILFIVWGLRTMRSEQYFRGLYRSDPGFCGRCGYDLTGNISGVCPECGWKLPDRKP